MGKLSTDWKDSVIYEEVEPVIQEGWHGELWCVHTGKAMLYIVAGEERWVPYSQIAPSSEVQRAGDTGDLEVSASFAHRNHWPECRCVHGFTTWHRFPDYRWCEGPFRWP